MAPWNNSGRVWADPALARDAGVAIASGLGLPLRFNREDIEIELVTLWIGHASPEESFKLSGSARFKPSTSECLDLCRGCIQVIYNEIEVHPVLPSLGLGNSLEPDGESLFRGRQDHELAVSDCRVNLNAEQSAPERGKAIRVHRVDSEVPHPGRHLNPLFPVRAERSGHCTQPRSGRAGVGWSPLGNDRLDIHGQIWPKERPKRLAA